MPRWPHSLLESGLLGRAARSRPSKQDVEIKHYLLAFVWFAGCGGLCVLGTAADFERARNLVVSITGTSGMSPAAECLGEYATCFSLFALLQ